MVCKVNRLRLPIKINKGFFGTMGVLTKYVKMAKGLNVPIITCFPRPRNVTKVLQFWAIGKAINYQDYHLCSKSFGIDYDVRWNIPLRLIRKITVRWNINLRLFRQALATDKWVTYANVFECRKYTEPFTCLTSSKDNNGAVKNIACLPTSQVDHCRDLMQLCLKRWAWISYAQVITCLPHCSHCARHFPLSVTWHGNVG